MTSAEYWKQYYKIAHSDHFSVDDIREIAMRNTTNPVALAQRLEQLDKVVSAT